MERKHNKQKQNQYNRLLRPRQAADMLAVTTETLRRWEQAGKITSIRIMGGQRRYLETELLLLLKICSSNPLPTQYHKNAIESNSRQQTLVEPKTIEQIIAEQKA